MILLFSGMMHEYKGERKLSELGQVEVPERHKNNIQGPNSCEVSCTDLLLLFNSMRMISLVKLRVTKFHFYHLNKVPFVFFGLYLHH